MQAIRQEVDRVLSELGAAVGTPLRLNAEGLIALEFADDITCTIEVPDGANRIFMHALVDRVPREGREAVLTRMLKRNLFEIAVPGAWLALDSDGEHILLCCSAPTQPADLDSLPDTLLALVTEAGELRRLLLKHDDSGADTGQDRPAFDASTMFFRG